MGDPFSFSTRFRPVFVFIFNRSAIHFNVIVASRRNRGASAHCPPERGCVVDQPQQLRKTSLLKYA
jgi:hypothetical protein